MDYKNVLNVDKIIINLIMDVFKIVQVVIQDINRQKHVNNVQLIVKHVIQFIQMDVLNVNNQIISRIMGSVNLNVKLISINKMVIVWVRNSVMIKDVGIVRFKGSVMSVFLIMLINPPVSGNLYYRHYL
jgi:hypothetical protein